jgi:formate dehydrogenase subunit gamma
MSQPSVSRELERFGPGSRAVHRATAVLGLTCLVTAAALYLEPIAELVGRRALVVQIHVWSGLALPVPVLLGWASRAVRSDYRLLNRWTWVDGEWLRRRDRRTAELPVGKFNAGQKLNAAFTVGFVVVMVMTGSVMYWNRWWPVAWRTGATFVHDWLAFAVAVVVLGHIWMAWNDPVARLGMRTGWVPLSWVRREHGAWVPDVVEDEDDQADASSPGDPGTAARSRSRIPLPRRTR